MNPKENHVSTAIERHQPTAVGELLQTADLFVKSGMFKDTASVAAAFVKIQAGAEMGIPPFQAMGGIHIISGKPVVGANMLASLLDQHPQYDYHVEWSDNEDACTVTISKDRRERGSSTFSLDDAKRAGLTGGNWTKYPRNMLFARAISNAIRMYAPGVTGGTPVYTEGEIEEIEPVDMAELHANAAPSTEPMPRVRISADGLSAVREASRGLTRPEALAAIQRVNADADTPQALWDDEVEAVIAALGDARVTDAEVVG
jgi:hypothetical protein